VPQLKRQRPHARPEGAAVWEGARRGNFTPVPYTLDCCDCDASKGNESTEDKFKPRYRKLTWSTDTTFPTSLNQ